MRTYAANDEKWDVYLSEEQPRDGLRPLIFHCTTNTSYGWRVVEVPTVWIDQEGSRVSTVGDSRRMGASLLRLWLRRQMRRQRRTRVHA